MFWLDIVYNERWLVNLFKRLLLFRSVPLSHLSIQSPAAPLSPTLLRGWHFSAVSETGLRGCFSAVTEFKFTVSAIEFRASDQYTSWALPCRALSLSVLMLCRCKEVVPGLWRHHAAEVSRSHLQQLDHSLLFFPLVRWTNVRVAGGRAFLGLFSLDRWFWVVFICQRSPRLSSPPSRTEAVSDRVGWNWFQLLRTEVYF